MKNIISINALSKSYKSGFNALKNVSLDIIKGEIFALLGPNGAGKTTLISIITGITTPTSGTVIVNNYDCNERRIASDLGIECKIHDHRGYSNREELDEHIVKSFRKIITGFLTKIPRIGNDFFNILF